MKNKIFFITLGILSILIFAGFYLFIKLKSTNIVEQNPIVEQLFPIAQFNNKEILNKQVCNEVLNASEYSIKICELQQKDKNTFYKHSIQVYPIEKRVKIEPKNFYACGKNSEDRRFCMNQKRGINVDVIEEGQFLWYIIDLYLLDNENNLIAKYNNAIIICCDVVHIEEFLPLFEENKASILLIKNDAAKNIEFNIGTMKDSDILKSSDIVNAYINKDGNLYK